MWPEIYDVIEVCDIIILISDWMFWSHVLMHYYNVRGTKWATQVVRTPFVDTDQSNTELVRLWELDIEIDVKVHLVVNQIDTSWPTVGVSDNHRSFRGKAPYIKRWSPFSQHPRPQTAERTWVCEYWSSFKLAYMAKNSRAATPVIGNANNFIHSTPSHNYVVRLFFRCRRRCWL